jgi:hypothetical protein
LHLDASAQHVIFILGYKDIFIMRAYTVATVAVTLNVPLKWIDNVITHHPLAGVTRAKQGVPRRLTERAVVVLAVALDLIQNLRIPLQRALELASDLTGTQGREVRLRASPASVIHLALNLEDIENRVSARLAHAVEIAPVPRRGRPPSR